MVGNKSINPDRLKAQRTRMKMSQQQLAEKIRVDVGTVSRWECGRVTNVRMKTLVELTDVLEITDDELCGEGSLTEKPSSDKPSRKDQMNVIIDGANRNALAFVAKRYGVTRQQIVEVAPLLFFIAAEQSLRERAEKLDRFWESLESAKESWPAHIVPDWYHHIIDDNSSNAEKESIRSRDLFGVKAGLEVTNEATENPFARFLTNQLKSIQTKSAPVQWSVGDSPFYSICAKDVLDYLNGDKNAAILVIKGCVTLRNMPTEVRKSSAPERATWVRDIWEKLTEEEPEISIDLDDLLAQLENTTLEADDDL